MEGEFDPLADESERRVLYATLDSFGQYRRTSHHNVTHLRRQSFYALPSAHWELLAQPPFSILDTFNAVDDAIDANANLSEAILAAGLEAYGIEQPSMPPTQPLSHSNPGTANESPSSLTPPWHSTATPSDLEKANSTIRQLHRDWSASGGHERARTHAHIHHTLTTHFSHVPSTSRHQIRILVPGAGLGRLLFDLCTAGYSVEGNEISYHQLIASYFILNQTTRAEEWDLYPFATTFSNQVSRTRQLRSVRVPDVHPAEEFVEKSQGHEVPASERMSMTAGDFCVVYRGLGYKGAFDVIATVFFIDTAPNFIRYIETVRNCLKVGGLWINVGPLLWHFEKKASSRESVGDEGIEGQQAKDLDWGIGEPGSVELTHEEAVMLLKKFGFEVIDGGNGEPTGYIQDEESMLLNLYVPRQWTARLKDEK
ncbi:MAG: hypothetical protein M1820_003497 [Bogoriella megaspora]|nr:MAG: hypothetical protein M1820_003497 [Bogoriella megaspora]